MKTVLDSVFILSLLGAEDLAKSRTEITELLDKIYQANVSKSVKREMRTLAGDLKTEWSGRAKGVKGDWMARYIPEIELEEGATEANQPAETKQTAASEMEGEVQRQEVRQDAGQDDSQLLPPTILTDTAERDEMVSRVDHIVNSTLDQTIPEAEKRITLAVSETELIELEVFFGGVVLETRQDYDEDQIAGQVVWHLTQILDDLE